MRFTKNSPFLGGVILGVSALSFFSLVGADFAQCVPGWEWSYNSKGQNPCEIAGSLQAACLGFSVYVLGPLSNGTNYVTPQKNDTMAKNCGCNTVIYSLYTSCALCQFNTSSTPLTWAFWSQFCDTVYVTQYPLSIPFNASVPHWAYLNDTNPSFDPVLAQAAGSDPEASPSSPSTVPPSSTSSLRSSSNSNPDTPTTTTRTSPSLSTASGSGGTKTNTGAIAGGVVGGIIGFGVIATLTFFLLKRRRGNRKSNAFSDQMAYNPPADRQSHEPPRLYDPSDPSTFPSPLSAGDSSNSGGYTTNPYQAGRYNGAAEL